MKILCSLLIILIFSVAGIAQEKQNRPENEYLMREKLKQRYELFELSPKLMFPNLDGLVFSDSIRRLPGQIPTTTLPENDLYAQSAMPIAIPGPEFSSDMPVVVPDSSVHYFILQKHIELYRPLVNRKK